MYSQLIPLNGKTVAPIYQSIEISWFRCMSRKSRRYTSPLKSADSALWAESRPPIYQYENLVLQARFSAQKSGPADFKWPVYVPSSIGDYRHLWYCLSAVVPNKYMFIYFPHCCVNSRQRQYDTYCLKNRNTEHLGTAKNMRSPCPLHCEQYLWEFLTGWKEIYPSTF